MNIFSKIGSAIAKGIRGIGSYAKKHKIISGIVVLIIIGAGWWGYTAYAKANTASEYTLAYATEGPLATTVTDSGQVSAEHQLNLTPQASGEVEEVNVTPGEYVTAGTVVAELDMTTAQEAVTSAQQDLESAQISYQQTLTSSQNSVSSDQTSLNSANTSAASSISSTYSALPGIFSGFDTTLHEISTLTGYNAEESVDAYADYINTTEASQDRLQVETDYTNAVSAYQSTLATYQAYNVTTATPQQTEQMAQTSLQALQTLSQALRDSLDYYNYVSQEIQSGDKVSPPELSTQISTLTTDLNTANSDISSITSANTSLQNAEQQLDQDTQSSANSDTSLTVQTAQLNVQKAQESLDQAEQNEQDYIVTAPFDGTIASVAVKKYDQASSGTAVAVLITNQDYADLSVNEADASKLQVGQSATLTFDALPNLTMNGSVAEIDQVGTVSSGVVTYDVQVGFDGTNSQVKPGMTVEATITTASSTDAIQVPSAAVHTTGNLSYVEVAKVASTTLAADMKGGTGAAGAGRTRTGGSASSTGYGGYSGARNASTTSGFGSSSFAGGSSTSTGAFATSGSTTAIARTIDVPVKDVTITRVPVTVGISNNTTTQITSGLSRGELVVTGTISTAKTTTSAAASATTRTTGAGGFGGAGAGGGALRAGGGAGVGGAAILRGG